MVHAWCHEVKGNGEPGYRGHGPVFADKCNEIGAKLGVPPVAPKGRGGMADCAHWPHRPPGCCARPPKTPTKPKPAPSGSGADLRPVLDAARALLSTTRGGSSSEDPMAALLRLAGAVESADPSGAVPINGDTPDLAMRLHLIRALVIRGNEPDAVLDDLRVFVSDDDDDDAGPAL